jgi:hypothetical protein
MMSFDTEPGATTPAGVQDLRRTSDIRLVMIEVAKIEERVNFLLDSNKDIKSDFRWTWTGLVLGFLILASALIYGYFRLDDKIYLVNGTLIKIEQKLDDLKATLPPAIKH